MDKKISTIICIISIAFAILTATAATITAVILLKEETPIETTLVIKVVNLRNEVVPDAKIIIVESGKSFFTGADGKTPQMSVPYNGNEEWGSVTVAVFKNGYVDYLLYNCIVYPNRTRLGPTIRLFDDSENSPEIIVFTENPPDSYSARLLHRLKLYPNTTTEEK